MDVKIIDIGKIAGRTILAPLLIHASPGEEIALEWHPQRWIALKGLDVWRVPPQGITAITPMSSLSALFSVIRYNVGPTNYEPGVGIHLTDLVWSGLVAGPGVKLDIVIVGANELPPETPCMVTVAVEPPPPCFRPRAVA